MSAVDVLAVIEHDGGQWRVIAKGATRPEDGFIYCHLTSTTRFVQQRNGKRPVQIADWIAPEVLAQWLVRKIESERNKRDQT